MFPLLNHGCFWLSCYLLGSVLPRICTYFDTREETVYAVQQCFFHFVARLIYYFNYCYLKAVVCYGLFILCQPVSLTLQILITPVHLALRLPQQTVVSVPKPSKLRCIHTTQYTCTHPHITYKFITHVTLMLLTWRIW